MAKAVTRRETSGKGAELGTGQDGCSDRRVVRGRGLRASDKAGDVPLPVS